MNALFLLSQIATLLAIYLFQGILSPLKESHGEARTGDKRKIREIFLRLAEIFHPDKVKDSDTQTYNTEIMKSINQAYQEGDLARLLEIERLHQVGEIIDLIPI